MRFLSIFTVLFLLLTTTAHADRFLDTVVDQLHADSAKSGASIEVDEGMKAGTVQNKAASETVDFVNSEEFQAKLQVEQERIAEEVFGFTPEVMKSYYSDVKRPGKGKRYFERDERVYIFISSSVPEDTLRAYARDIERIGSYNVVMVMRGMIGGMKYGNPTFKYLAKVLQKDVACKSHPCDSFSAEILIDPLLFRTYTPSKVPAVVYVKGVHLDNLDMSEGDPDNLKENGNWWMIYGDAPLSYVFDQIGKESGVKKLQELSLTLQ